MLLNYLKVQKTQIIFLTSILIQVPMLFFNISEADSFRFSQTTTVIREFMLSGFDYRTPLPIFGANSFVPFEFPLFQGIAAFVGNLFNFSPTFAARFTALAFFQLSALLTYKLTFKLFNKETALITLFLFQFTPFGLRYAHAPLIEFASLSFILFSLWLFLQIIDVNSSLKKVTLYCLGTVFLILGFVTKATTGLALIPIFLLFFFSVVSDDKRLRRLISSGIFVSIPLWIAICVTLYWNTVADSIKKQNGIAAFLVSTTEHMMDWNFGTLGLRLDPKTWVTILVHHLGPISGGIFVLLLLMAFGYRIMARDVFLVLFLTILLPILIFTNLYFSHTYYFAAVYPIIIMFIANGILGIARWISTTESQKVVVLCSALIISFGFSTKYGVNYLSDMINHSKVPALAMEINEIAPAGSNILYLDCDWNPEIPFYVDSEALMIPEWDVKLNQSDLDRINLIVFCDYHKFDRSSLLNKYFPSEDFTWVSKNIVSRNILD
jgi:4-amino-4-deoxy-L-arabinose transferase-like glycosyltransferase